MSIKFFRFFFLPIKFIEVTLNFAEILKQTMIYKSVSDSNKIFRDIIRSKERPLGDNLSGEFWYYFDKMREKWEFLKYRNDVMKLKDTDSEMSVIGLNHSFDVPVNSDLAESSFLYNAISNR